MTTTRVAGLLLLLGAAPAALGAQTSLTIYNDGRVLMRRTVPVAVPKGASTQRVPFVSSHVESAPQLPMSWKSTSSLQKSDVLVSGVW